MERNRRGLQCEGEDTASSSLGEEETLFQSGKNSLNKLLAHGIYYVGEWANGADAKISLFV